ncbi:MAG: c-type cytochrome [Fimbriimonadaceae bacterium]|nr:c-type cytochrome [Fimbriimonadaceae bacterium]QYK56411.1 MAG: c-type cytochrome [Fimbriimonadaceae bacterium]
MNLFKTLPVMPVQASERAFWHDLLFFTITGLSVIFTILVFLLILRLATTYRQGSPADRRNPVYHSLKIESLLIGVPLVLGLAIFVWASLGFVNYRKTPEKAMEIFVVGKQWMWHLQHMNGVRENNELHVPVDTPIKLTMISQDVIHAMYLPEFRAQYHVVPGRYTDLNFTATRIGKYKMLCNMYCGTQHSEMVGLVHVMSKGDFAKWMENNANRYQDKPLTMAAAGAQTWKDLGCGNCHGQKDTLRGPSLYGIFGTRRTFSDGSSKVADNDYLRESILTPWLLLTRGYEASMPAYKGQITEERVLALVEYMKTLTAEPGGEKAAAIEPGFETSRPTSSPQNSTDVANRRASAPAMQQEQGATRE